MHFKREPGSADTTIMGLRGALAFSVVTLTLGMIGCCDTIHGRLQTIPLRVEPSGATVTVSPDEPDRSVTVAPGRLILHRKGTYVVHVVKDGYQPVDEVVTHERSALRWLNLAMIHPAFWGAGLIVDEATGAGYNLTPEALNVTLAPASTSASETAGR